MLLVSFSRGQRQTGMASPLVGDKKPTAAEAAAALSYEVAAAPRTTKEHMAVAALWDHRQRLAVERLIELSQALVVAQRKATPEQARQLDALEAQAREAASEREAAIHRARGAAGEIHARTQQVRATHARELALPPATPQ